MHTHTYIDKNNIAIKKNFFFIHMQNTILPRTMHACFTLLSLLYEYSFLFRLRSYCMCCESKESKRHTQKETAPLNKYVETFFILYIPFYIYREQTFNLSAIIMLVCFQLEMNKKRGKKNFSFFYFIFNWK